MNNSCQYELRQPARALAYASSPEARWLVAGCAARERGSIVALQANAGQVNSPQTWQLHTPAGACALSCSPDARHAVTLHAGPSGSGRASVHVWDLSTDEAQRLKCDSDHAAQQQSVTWSRGDDAMFLTSSSSALTAWRIREHHVTPGSVNVAVYCNARSWHLCDLRTGSCQGEHEQAHSLRIQAVDMAATAPHMLATASQDSTIKVWDIRAGTTAPPTAVIDCHEHWVWDVHFHPQHAHVLLSASSDGSARVTMLHAPECAITQGWAPQTSRCIQQVKHQESMMACRWASSDTWAWACLSYEGQVSITAVPKADAAEAAWQMHGTSRDVTALMTQ